MSTTDPTTEPASKRRDDRRDDRPADDELHARIRRDLPEGTFDRRPWRALWFVPPALIVAASMTLVIRGHVSPVAGLLLAVVIGQCFAIMGFLAHECLHGSMVRSRGLQTALGHLGFGPFLVSPTLWRTWHNQVHHAKTNMGNADPDSFGTLSRYREAPSTRYVARLAPGSGHWYSAFFLGYWFVFHGQVVLWIQAPRLRSFARMNRRRAVADSAAGVVAWAVIAWLAGPVGSLYVMVLPMIVANATVMSYIATNHFMRPQTATNDPVENSMSVTTLPVIDRLHANFSHHVEHHLFPRMSAANAPLVRRWLLEHEADRYVSPPHARAVAALYRTPRVYLDATTLCDPEDLTRRVDVADVTRELTRAG